MPVRVRNKGTVSMSPSPSALSSLASSPSPSPAPNSSVGSSSTRERRRRVPCRRFLAALAFLAMLAWNVHLSYVAPPPPLAGTPVASFVFPSREERLRYYMGDWYDAAIRNGTDWDPPPSLCEDVPYYDSRTFEGRFPDKAFQFDATNARQIEMRYYGYRRDILTFLFSSTSWLSFVLFLSPAKPSPPDKRPPSDQRLIISIGDDHPSTEYPVIMKSREPKNIQREKGRHVPILALLNTWRHYTTVSYVGWLQWLGFDTPWHRKADGLVWRGAKNGKRKALVEKFLSAHNATGSGIPATKTSGIPMDVAFEPSISVTSLLKYKYLLSLEGNDVATGLKWMLFSGSVVFMPEPVHVTWAMEDLLVPYVHYVPVEADLLDLPAKLEWAHQNDDTVREISRQAKLYMENLYMGPQAEEDNVWIHQQIVRRYRDQFDEGLKKC